MVILKFMDLIKIGKYISKCRKDKNLTQEELAEKLFITNRAVSKWERGLSLPDADKMLDLCKILGINVNELLTGEKIDMKDYNKKTEELLVELSKQEEANNKRMICDMWVLAITALVFYLIAIYLTIYSFGDSSTSDFIVGACTILLFCVATYAFKLEVNAGYYECKNCHHRYKTTYLKAFLAPHFSTTRYLKCPKCNKRSWSKKVMSKE